MTQLTTTTWSSPAPARWSPAVTERWAPLPDSTGYYSVSDEGRVRSEPVQTSSVGRQRGRVLKCSRDSKGYLQFRICLPGGRHRQMKVHRAVALAFLGDRPAGCQINHKSGDKLNNAVGNLEYVSCRENIRHGWKTGLYGADHCRGERNPFAKLTAADVRQIRDLSSTTSLTNLASRFGVKRQTIWQILKGKTWRHVV